MNRVVAITFLVAALATSSPSQAAVTVYVAFLDGLSESPPNASPGTGFARVEFDPVAHILRVEATFSDLIGTTTAAHIHAPTAVPGMGTAGVATQVPSFSGFPLGVTSGSYDMTFDTTMASTYNPAYVTANGGTAAGAEAALGTALADGKAYFNIHTTVFGGGEIRGFFQAEAVPEPASLAIWGLAALSLVGFGRRRR